MLKKIYNKLNQIICFAVKSNTNTKILNEIKKFNLGADVVSIGEMMKALKAGIKPNKIVFSGVGKTHSEIKFAIEKKILLISVTQLLIKKILLMRNLVLRALFRFTVSQSYLAKN